MNEITDAHETTAIARAEPATHYPWSDGCDGWQLVETSGLRIREEHILAGVAHEVCNDAGDPVRFLVVTAPAVDGDREGTPALSGRPTR